MAEPIAPVLETSLCTVKLFLVLSMVVGLVGLNGQFAARRAVEVLGIAAVHATNQFPCLAASTVGVRLLIR